MCLESSADHVQFNKGNRRIFQEGVEKKEFESKTKPALSEESGHFLTYLVRGHSIDLKKSCFITLLEKFTPYLSK